jgi:hypothetical protein
MQHAVFYRPRDQRRWGSDIALSEFHILGTEFQRIDFFQTKTTTFRPTLGLLVSGPIRVAQIDSRPTADAEATLLSELHRASEALRALATSTTATLTTCREG